MHYTIDQGLERINFHDSSIKALSRADDLLTLNFDWAHVQAYQEGPACFDIVVGKCCLTLDGVTSEIFLNHGNTVDMVQTLTIPQAHQPIDIEQSFAQISLSAFSATAYGQCLSLGGVYEGIEGVYWLECQIQFKKGRFNWNNHVTIIDWQNGSVPE